MGDLRVGIIGCGALGVIHARRFGANSKCSVTALADPVVTGLDRAVAELGARPAIVTQDYRRLLDADLDIVCIATPDALHTEQVLQALERGLHVLCEKPLTPVASELTSIQNAVRVAGTHVALTYPRRYDPGFQAMRAELQSGAWGKVTLITAYNAEDWITPNRGTWRHNPALCPGGFIFDASGHQLDALMWVTGLYGQQIKACIDNRNSPVPLAAWGSAELDSHVPLIFAFAGDAHKWREQVNIHCEGAEFVTENGSAWWVRGGRIERLAEGEAHVTADDAFVNLVCGEGPNQAPLHEVWPVLSLTEALFQSAATGQTARVRPVESVEP